MCAAHRIRAIGARRSRSPSAAPADLDTVLAPARRAIGEIIGDYPADQRAILFDCFDRAAAAYQRAAEEIGGGTVIGPARRARSGSRFAVNANNLLER
ncbi:hypothetical protein [Nocardia acidivorans]|uniref:hypothetical protein n=1 Tax=Nocardia acidivorans TaxID=404580 RepID=UPI00082E7B01|nr:hypothetical protein [Nocardia acidivorans]